MHLLPEQEGKANVVAVHVVFREQAKASCGMGATVVAILLLSRL